MVWGPVLWDLNRVPKSKNPFHKGNLGNQTTWPQTNNLSLADHFFQVDTIICARSLRKLFFCLTIFKGKPLKSPTRNTVSHLIGGCFGHSFLEWNNKAPPTKQIR